MLIDAYNILWSALIASHIHFVYYSVNLSMNYFILSITYRIPPSIYCILTFTCYTYTTIVRIIVISAHILARISRFRGINHFPHILNLVFTYSYSLPTYINSYHTSVNPCACHIRLTNSVILSVNFDIIFITLSNIIYDHSYILLVLTIKINMCLMNSYFVYTVSQIGSFDS